MLFCKQEAEVFRARKEQFMVLVSKSQKQKPEKDTEKGNKDHQR